MQEIKTDPPKIDDSEKSKKVIKPLEEDGSSLAGKFSPKVLLAFLLVIALGVVSGYAVYARNTKGTIRLAGKDVEIIKTKTEEGVKDAATFKDTATGLLIENDGKITTEGTHILQQKPGDVSQNAYLTSSVIDLSKYVGKKVQVWGETFQGRKAGWLMDVGRIKIAE